MTRYVQHPVSGDGWTGWIVPLQPGYKIKCCDCGLVHEMDFRVKEGQVQFRARRNDRSTAMVKRHKARNTDAPVTKKANITFTQAQKAVKDYIEGGHE